MLNTWKEEFAYHEAGHAVAVHLMKCSYITLVTITTPRDSRRHGGVDHTLHDSIHNRCSTDAIYFQHVEKRRIIISMAGRATGHLYGGSSLGADDDKMNEWERAISLCDDGYEDGILVDDARQRQGMIIILKRLYGRTQILVKTRRFQRAVEALAQTLLDRGSLQGPEAHDIIARALQKEFAIPQEFD